MTERTRQAQWIALLAVTAVAIYLCWKMLEPFVFVLIWAAVLVIVFYPAHRRIRAIARQPAVGAALTIVLILATVIAPLVLIVSAVARELTVFTSSAPDQWRALLADPDLGPRIQSLLDSVKAHVDVDRLVSPEAIQDLAGKVSQSLITRTVSLVGGAFGLLTDIVFVIFAAYYLFRDGDDIARRLPDALPLERARGERILERTVEVIRASVFGIAVIAGVQGLLGGLMFWILDIPSALLWGVLMTVVSTIPILGAFLVWIPAAGFLALTGHPAKAIILVVWGGVVIGSLDNFLRPRLVGKRTRMHELFIFFSVLGGLKVFGVLGILLGPVVLAIASGLIEVARSGDAPLHAPAADESG